MVTRTKDSEYLFSYHWIATGRPLSLCLPIAPGIYKCNDTKGDTGLCKGQCFFHKRQLVAYNQFCGENKVVVILFSALTFPISTQGVVVLNHLKAAAPWPGEPSTPNMNIRNQLRTVPFFPFFGDPFRPPVFPLEIFSEVALHCTSGSILNLSKTCKGMSCFLLPFLLRRVELNSTESCFNFLEYLISKRDLGQTFKMAGDVNVNGYAQLAGYIQILIMRPTHERSYPHFNYSEPIAAAKAEQEIIFNNLAPLIPDLSSVRNFVWDGLHMPNESIWAALVTLQTEHNQLKYITANIESDTEEIPNDSQLFSFSDLFGFEIYERKRGVHPMRQAMITMLKHRCPNLKSLTIGSPTYQDALNSARPLDALPQTGCFWLPDFYLPRLESFSGHLPLFSRIAIMENNPSAFESLQKLDLLQTFTANDLENIPNILKNLPSILGFGVRVDLTASLDTTEFNPLEKSYRTLNRAAARSQKEKHLDIFADIVKSAPNLLHLRVFITSRKYSFELQKPHLAIALSGSKLQSLEVQKVGHFWQEHHALQKAATHLAVALPNLAFISLCVMNDENCKEIWESGEFTVERGGSGVPHHMVAHERKRSIRVFTLEGKIVERNSTLNIASLSLDSPERLKGKGVRQRLGWKIDEKEPQEGSSSEI